MTNQRELARQRLSDSHLYRIMQRTMKVMDRYYLDALIGLVPGWGDAVGLLSVLPFLYFSIFTIRSLPLTLAVLNNALRDVFLGLLPFFAGDIIDFFHRANIRNMQMVQGFVDGDERIIRTVNARAWQTGVACLLLIALIIGMVWLLITFISHLF